MISVRNPGWDEPEAHYPIEADLTTMMQLCRTKLPMLSIQWFSDIRIERRRSFRYFLVVEVVQETRC